MDNVPKPEEYGQHIARLNQESVAHKQRLEWQGQQIEELRQNYQALQTSQTEAKTLISTVITRFDGFEGRILTIFGQMTADSAKLLQQLTKGGQQERTQAQKSWVDFAKYTISATVGALIVYLLKGA